MVSKIGQSLPDSSLIAPVLLVLQAPARAGIEVGERQRRATAGAIPTAQAVATLQDPEEVR
jgi:hypothetical protein